MNGSRVKLNTLVAETPLITDASLAEWSEPGWTIDMPRTVGGDPQSFMPLTYLDGFFSQPAPLEE